MAHELDLDDAVANVSGDRARRELEELRAERDALAGKLKQRDSELERAVSMEKEFKRRLKYITETEQHGAMASEPRRLERICNEQLSSIDALDRECHRLKDLCSKYEDRIRLTERHNRDLRRLVRRVLRDTQVPGYLTDQVLYDVKREVER